MNLVELKVLKYFSSFLFALSFLICTFASILWVAKRCPPHGRHISESVFSFILIRKNRQFLKSIGLSGHKTPMRAYTHPIGGVLYIGVAWGGLFISVMGVWRCLVKNKLSNVPRLRVL